MKQILFIITIIFCLPQLQAQKKQGEIIYQVIQQPKKTDDKKVDPRFSAFMKKNNDPDTSKMILSYSENISLYKKYESEEDKKENKRYAYYSIGEKNDKSVYKNLELNKYIKKEILLGKGFLVTDSIPDYKWKFHNQQKKILDYTCMKITYQDTLITLEAWFTPQIPISFGPENFGNLPGVVLEIDINNGDRIITAEQIEIGKELEEEIKLPKKMKILDREKYEKLKKKKKEEQKRYKGW